jgi:3-phosphoshikimate 1-carboxyvinyltransferase
MGARIDTEAGGLPPLRIHGGQALVGIDHTLEVASAQVKSALLLAGLYADGETIVREPHPTRDYTERMLSAFGVDIEFSPGFARLRGGQRLRATDIAVPADFSSAAFFLVAARHRARLGIALEAGGHEPAPHRPAAGAADDGRRHRRGQRARAGRRTGCRPASCDTRRCAASRCRRHWCRT